MNIIPYVIYLRKSRSDQDAEQNEEVDVLQRHESILLELAKKMNLDVAEIYREIVSGETISSRPVMQRLLDEVGQGLWEGVLVTEVERLARGDSLDQGRIAQAFKFTNTKIITPMKTYDPNNEFDETFFEFGLFMSRQEYKTIRRRMARGREAAVREGKYIGTYPPYGYIKIKRGKDCTLEVNPEQAEIVKLIFNLYTSDENRLGYNSIADKLINMGVPSMRGSGWIASTVKAILKNPVYIGKLRWHYKKEVKKIVDGKISISTVANSDGNDYLLADGIHEAIIDFETWNKAQNYVKQIPVSPAPSSLGLKNPFAGIIICGKCGKKMVRKPYPNKPDSLYCYTRNCDNVGAYFYLVEREIFNLLEVWLNDYKLKDVDLKLQQSNQSNFSLKRKELNKCIKDKEVFQKQLNKAYNLLEQGIYEPDEFLDRSMMLKKSISDLGKNIQALSKELDIDDFNTNSISVKRTEHIIEAYKKIENCGEKNKLLKEVLSKVIYIREKRNQRGETHNKFGLKIFPKIK